MAYKKDYKTRLKDPDARPAEAPAKQAPSGGGDAVSRTSAPPSPAVIPAAPAPTAPPRTAEEIDDRQMGMAGADAAPAEEDDEGPDLPPDPEDLISHLPLERYQASGRYSFGGAVVAVLLGSLFNVILGALYGWATARLSISLLSLPICLLYGFLASIVVYLASQAGKLRSDGAVFVTALLAALAGWAASWVTFNGSMFNQGIAPYSPNTLDGMLGNVLVISSAGRGLFGHWVIYGQGVTMATWIVEGLFMLFFPPFLNLSIVGSTPFCEDCGKWVDMESYHFRVGPAPDLENFRKEVIRRGPAAIEELGPPTLDEYIEVKAHVCTLCQKVGFFNTQQLKKLGVNPRPTATNIDNNLVLKGLELRQMQDLVDRARASGQGVDPG